MLENLDRGVMLLDATGAVLDANSIARQVVDSGKGLLLRNGRLAFVDAAIDSRFERMLKPAGIADGKVDGMPRVVAASVKRPGAAACRVLVSPFLIEDGRSPVAGYLVVIYSPDEKPAIAAEVLLEIYGLTRAQADVARRLYAGLSVEETALALKLSLNTVRTHLKQIFSKCEVQSQAELLRALALGPRKL